MQFKNPMLDAYRKLVADVRVNVADELARGSSLLAGEDRRPPEVKHAATRWTVVDRALRAIDTAVTSFAEALPLVAYNQDLTRDAKDRRIADLRSQTETQIQQQVDTVMTGSRQILDGLRTAAYPARPTPVDATQETRLQGIKADLQMVLNPVSSDTEAMVRLGSMLERAIGDGDQLTSWLLASTRWPEDYLTSRGLEHMVDAWDSMVTGALNHLMPGPIAESRRVYNAVSNPQRGIPTLSVVLNQLPRIIADEVSSVPIH